MGSAEVMYELEAQLRWAEGVENVGMICRRHF